MELDNYNYLLLLLMPVMAGGFAGDIRTGTAEREDVLCYLMRWDQ